MTRLGLYFQVKDLIVAPENDRGMGALGEERDICKIQFVQYTWPFPVMELAGIPYS